MATTSITNNENVATENITYEGIKYNLKSYLSSLKIFKSINFEGTAVNLIIEAMAYIAFFITSYANFAIGESTLSTAQLRHNVVAHAKQIGYIPHQKNAAQVDIKLQYNGVTTVQPTEMVMSGTEFIGLSDNGNYKFITTENYNMWYKSSRYWYLDVKAYQGSFVTESFVFKQNNRYVLKNKNIDDNFLSVQVSSIDGESYETYELADSLSDFGTDKKLYFKEENYDGYEEIYFGDNILSYMPPDDSVIKVKYLVTDGADANNLVSFSSNDLGDNIVLDSSSVSYGGGDQESIESIKLNAPKYFQAQDRIVSLRDASSIIQNKYNGWIDSICCWGGEDHDPPTYSTIYICIKPKYADTVTENQKTDILNYIQPKSLPCISYDFIDPIYVYIIPTLYVDWLYLKSSITQNELSEKITSALSSTVNNSIEQFNSKLKYSNVLSSLESVDSSIDSVYGEFKLKQYITVDTSLSLNYNIKFNNMLKPGSVSIGPWKTTDGTSYMMKDDEEGNLVLYVDDVKTYTQGSVDYSTGDIVIEHYKFASSTYVGVIGNINVPVYTEVVSQNISTVQNYILTIDTSNITINISSVTG